MKRRRIDGVKARLDKSVADATEIKDLTLCLVTSNDTIDVLRRERDAAKTESARRAALLNDAVASFWFRLFRPGLTHRIREEIVQPRIDPLYPKTPQPTNP